MDQPKDMHSPNKSTTLAPQPMVDNIVHTPAPPPTMNEFIERAKAKLAVLNERVQATVNILSMRAQTLRDRSSQIRDYNNECKWPDTYSAWDYQKLYERHAIAARVVEVLVEESWKVQPLIYEDDDPTTNTPFEEDWDGLGASIAGEKSYFKQEAGSTVLEHLKRADTLCGIGHYGIILIGLNDGKELHEPAAGSGLQVGSGWGHMAPAVKNMVTANVMPKAGGVWSNDTSVKLDDPSKLTGNIQSLKTNKPKTDFTDPGDSYSQSTDGNSHGALGGKAPLVSAPLLGGGDDPRPNAPPPDRDFSQRDSQRPKLIYLRVFPEYLCPVSVWDADRHSPRYGKPVMYLVTFNDPSEGQYSGIGLATGTRSVHWTRVVHVVDNLGSSEVFGIPRMRPMLNELLDMRKVRGGGAEGYWQCCFPTTVFETIPQLGADVDVNIQGLKDMAEQVREGLERIYHLSGITAKTLSPQVMDPTAQLDKAIEFICIKLAIAVRIFKGSERGELASTQDDDQHKDRMKARQDNHVTPRVLVPFINRLIALGVLRPPAEENGFSISWPDMTSMSADQKAGVALKMVQALSAFIQGKCDELVTPMDFFTKFFKWDDQEAAAVLESATGTNPMDGGNTQLLDADDQPIGGDDDKGPPDGSIESRKNLDEVGQSSQGYAGTDDDDHWDDWEPELDMNAPAFDLPGGGRGDDPTATYAPEGNR